MYSTESEDGSYGHTTFVMKGYRQRSGYTDKFLVQKGCGEVS